MFRVSALARPAQVNALSRRFMTSKQWAELYWNDKFEEGEPRFQKVLVANRGEIACRVMQTCRRLGIKTVAVHSDVDHDAKFVKMADEAVCIGPAPTSQSYLRMENILKAVKMTGAEAVHPGYGFLSENTVFAKYLEEAGVVFLGPSSYSIKSMGDKIESKKFAHAAKVSTIPGYNGVIEDADMAAKIVKETIGYPVMIKASAGGGGKGLRIAWNEKELREGYRLSKSEAKSSFGDDRMLVERYIDNPRHIEMQVLGDMHGNVVYLNERECSIQRRNQKVIEEAPSTFIDEATRKEMGRQAVMLAKACKYHSAGTVEFLVDSRRNFFFLEMNTRLQVEHPITECITGIDIVHQMLRVGKGNKILHKQEDIPIKGWSIECRVYAEDPFKSFGLPSIGRLNAYVEPSESLEGVRCDSGIREGSDISIFYDPLICKLTTYGKDRQFALDRMVEALDRYVIRGVTHNISLLRDVLTEKRFVKGDISTKYLPQTYPDGFKGKTLTARDLNETIALAAAVHLRKQQVANAIQNSRRVSTIDFTKEHEMVVLKDGKQHHVKVTADKGDNITAVLENGEKVTLTVPQVLSQRTNEITIDNNSQMLQLVDYSFTGKIQMQYLGTIFNLQVMSAAAGALKKFCHVPSSGLKAGMIIAPMPGVIKSIAVQVGQMVSDNQEICILEAMKMQNSLVAPKQGKVKKINGKVGETMAEGAVIVELE
jgi:propionyl-CoA carboxylase alpha chain